MRLLRRLWKTWSPRTNKLVRFVDQRSTERATFNPETSCSWLEDLLEDCERLERRKSVRLPLGAEERMAREKAPKWITIPFGFNNIEWYSAIEKSLSDDPH